MANAIVERFKQEVMCDHVWAVRRDKIVVVVERSTVVERWPFVEVRLMAAETRTTNSQKCSYCTEGQTALLEIKVLLTHESFKKKTNKANIKVERSKFKIEW